MIQEPHSTAAAASSAASAAAAAVAGKNTALGGGAVAAIGGFMHNEWAAIAGVVIGLAGLALQWHSKRRHQELLEREDARQEREHQARMRRLEAEQ